MKTKILKLTFLLLMFLLIFTIPSLATEEPTKHTIRIEVPANEDVVMPYIWDNGSFSPIYSNNYTLTAPFTVNEINFAYESNATDINGNYISGTYTISLLRASTNGVIYSSHNTINGQTKKEDWINVENGETYRFKLQNNSSSDIAIYLVYYSW